MCSCNEALALRAQFSLYRLGSRRRLELEPPIRDRHVFLHLVKTIFRDRSIHFLDDNSRNLVFRA